MRITFLGGADEVGASSILLEIGGKQLLVDAGIRPSPKAHWGLDGDQLPNLSQIHTLITSANGGAGLDAVLVTHAHTDHTGALELVTGHFPDVPVYATPATIALTRVLHQDSRRIMQSRLDEEGELPLFDDVAVESLMSAFVPLPFNQRLRLGQDLVVTFFPAGHIAGAAMIGLESSEGHLLITGDVSISPQRTVDGAKPPAFNPDIIISESTYGGRLHANRAVQERKLVEAVAQTLATDGKVLIPAFALGRAQEVLLILSEHQRRGQLPIVPIWADGMVRAICQAYTSFAEVLPLPLQERGATFFQGNVRPVKTYQHRNALIWEAGPAVIVASSGMLAGGPSLSYARALAGHPQHAILLTGYQDEEAPGRRLQEVAQRGSGTIRLGDKKVDMKCQLGTYSLSAHADEGQIISLVETLGPQHVILVHGDSQARTSLEKGILARGRTVHLPRAGESLTFQFKKRKILGPSTAAVAYRSRWVEQTRERTTSLEQFTESVGKWLLIKGNPPTPARCLALEHDRLWVEVAPGLEQSVWPEDILTVFGTEPPTDADLAAYLPKRPTPEVMEPNQALAFANQHFPPEAGLRKCGYRLDEGTLLLTFDFPDVAGERYADRIDQLAAATGWTVSIAPEANQAALNILVQEVLPQGWQITKGPAIHRDEKRVAITAAPASSQGDAQVFPLSGDQSPVNQFFETSGFKLDITLAESPEPANVIIPDSAGTADEPWEINAAHAVIRSKLAGSTLYKSSLKGGQIVLSFISPQVGARYQEQIATLSRQTGWPMSINPNANQGAILEIARRLLDQAEMVITKGPGIHVDKGEVAVTLAETPGETEVAGLCASFEAETGFQLKIHQIQIAASSAEKRAYPEVVEIPLARVHLRPYHHNLTLDPEKLEKAVVRARRMGIKPPIEVRRLKDGYLLNDGLYRLRATEELGWEHIPAVVV
jgi:Cft2 family RNA processing exonuclease